VTVTQASINSHLNGFRLEPYSEQMQRWPLQGRHILAHYDESSITVYQAYNAQIGRYAVQHQTFGGEFSYSRMSWIKPNFLWMMYRSGWATKENQEVVLAITLSRAFFDELLEMAVESSFRKDRFPTQEEWKQKLKGSEVRLQWDPDHDPQGDKIQRRALQIGIRGQMLERYAQEGIQKICDITPFVQEMSLKKDCAGYEELLLPQERLYMPASMRARSNARIDE